MTQTKTIQLVSYGVRKVLKDTDTFHQKRKQQYTATDTDSASTLLVSNKYTEVNPITVMSDSLNYTTLHKAFREEFHMMNRRHPPAPRKFLNTQMLNPAF